MAFRRLFPLRQFATLRHKLIDLPHFWHYRAFVTGRLSRQMLR